jgi:hypothetical protein
MASARDLPLPYIAPRAHPATGTHADPELERVRKLARILDHYLVDPVIGLVLPGAGDIVGSLLGLYAVAIALRRKMSPVIIARMLLNLGLDAILGIVPLLGDITDVAFKANQRNVALLTERSAVEGGRATAKDWMMVIGAALVFVAAIVGVVYLLGRVIHALGG